MVVRFCLPPVGRDAIQENAMQLTLVSHYQDKPPEFSRLLTELQASLTRTLGDAFCPYELAQIHGTLIGLEGTESAERVWNTNFRRYRNEQRPIDFGELLAYLRNNFSGFIIRIGGFTAAESYGFDSQGRHPFLRSFSLQEEIAVAMGWPFRDGAISSALDQLRKRLQRYGLLHKWQRRPNDVDNDFFFVLGRLTGAVPAEARQAAENDLRDQLSRREPLLLSLSRDSLSFVAYRDSQLPLASSRARRLTETGLTAEALRRMY